MRAVLLLLGGITVSGLVGACSGAHESRHDSVSVAARRNDTPQLDIASLLGLTIDEVSGRMGPPRPVPPAFRDPTLIMMAQAGEVVDSTSLFHYRGLNVIVSYNHATRQVKDLLMVGENEDELMWRGQLQLGHNQYLVLPVFQKRRPTELLGLRVLAANTGR